MQFDNTPMVTVLFTDWYPTHFIKKFIENFVTVYEHETVAPKEPFTLAVMIATDDNVMSDGT